MNLPKPQFNTYSQQMRGSVISPNFVHNETVENREPRNIPGYW